MSTEETTYRDVTVPLDICDLDGLLMLTYNSFTYEAPTQIKQWRLLCNAQNLVGMTCKVDAVQYVNSTLKASEEEHKSILNSGADLVIVIDNDERHMKMHLIINTDLVEALLRRVNPFIARLLANDVPFDEGDHILTSELCAFLEVDLPQSPIAPIDISQPVRERITEDVAVLNAYIVRNEEAISALPKTVRDAILYPFTELFSRDSLIAIMDYLIEASPEVISALDSSINDISRVVTIRMFECIDNAEGRVGSRLAAGVVRGEMFCEPTPPVDEIVSSANYFAHVMDAIYKKQIRHFEQFEAATKLSIVMSSFLDAQQSPTKTTDERVEWINVKTAQAMSSVHEFLGFELDEEGKWVTPTITCDATAVHGYNVFAQLRPDIYGPPKLIGPGIAGVRSNTPVSDDLPTLKKNEPPYGAGTGR